MLWLTIQKFIIFYCPLDGEHTKMSPGGLLYTLLVVIIFRTNTDTHSISFRPDMTSDTE